MLVYWTEVGNDRETALATIVTVARELGSPCAIRGGFATLHAFDGEADRAAFVDLCCERVAAKPSPVSDRAIVEAREFAELVLNPPQAREAVLTLRGEPGRSKCNIDELIKQVELEDGGGLKQVAADYVKAPSGLDAWKSHDLSKYGELPNDEL